MASWIARLAKHYGLLAMASWVARLASDEGILAVASYDSRLASDDRTGYGITNFSPKSPIFTMFNPKFDQNICIKVNL